MKQERIQKQKGRRGEGHADDTNSDVTNPELAAATEDVLEDIEEALEEQFDAELLADLDELMGSDEEAVQMVTEYVQMGGE